MIPIRDAVRSTHFPIVNLSIIAVNVLVFLWQFTQGSYIEQALFYFGIVPARYSNPELAVHFTHLEQVLPFLTSMFLHGGILHILGNMWFLYIFGDNIEDRIGHFRYLIFYLLCGVAAGVIHLLTNWGSEIPTIGASGAIAGVMGGYVLLFPRAKVLTLVPIFFFFQFFEIPAFVFLGYWLLIQIMSGSASRSDVGGVAWWAHIGGFLAGFITVKVFEKIPRTGLNEGLQRYTERHSTPRIQKIFPSYLAEEPDVQGVITITSREARQGGRKLISIPQGSRRRNHLVTFPPGVEDGTRLRLKGLGRVDPEGKLGDLFLKVQISD